MDRHRRMARTLGCLVASMTLGAAVLDWIQPSRGGPHPAIELIARGNPSPTWSGIRIVPQSPSIQPRKAHFVVDREGNPAATEYWLNQRRIGSESVVRVGLIAASGTNEVTLPQWLAAQELVNGLEQACRIPVQRVVLEDTLAVPPSASMAARLRQR